MKEENTRSKNASGYGSASANAWSNRMASPSRFALLAARASWIGIQADDLDARMKALDERDERARAAADVESLVTRSKLRLIEERGASPIASEKLHEWVVKRQEQVVPGRGEKGPSRLCNRLRFGRHVFLAFVRAGSREASVTSQEFRIRATARQFPSARRPRRA
jgi:hypothetical protein